MLETVDAGHFLDQVFFNLKVETVRRRADDEVIAFDREIQAQATKDLRDLFLRDGHAQHAVATRQAHAHGRTGRQVDDLVVDGADLAAADIDDQAGDEFQVLGDAGVIHATLEAVAGFRAELVAACAARNGLRPPERSFQIDVLRIQRHGGGFAPMMPARLST